MKTRTLPRQRDNYRGGEINIFWCCKQAQHAPNDTLGGDSEQAYKQSQKV